MLRMVLQLVPITRTRKWPAVVPVATNLLPLDATEVFQLAPSPVTSFIFTLLALVDRTQYSLLGAAHFCLLLCSGSGSRTRTYDPRINSPLLYQLSYAGVRRG